MSSDKGIGCESRFDASLENPAPRNRTTSFLAEPTQQILLVVRRQDGHVRPFRGGKVLATICRAPLLCWLTRLPLRGIIWAMWLLTATLLGAIGRRPSLKHSWPAAVWGLGQGQGFLGAESGGEYGRHDRRRKKSRKPVARDSYGAGRRYMPKDRRRTVEDPVVRFETPPGVQGAGRLSASHPPLPGRVCGQGQCAFTSRASKASPASSCAGTWGHSRDRVVRATEDP